MKHENPGSGPVFDLFGNEILPLRDRRGRPSYKKTKENQDFVAVRAAAGWTQAKICEALGCSEKTLRANFSRELSDGLLLVEGVCLDVLMRGARAGHVPSVKALQSRLDRVATGAPKAKEKKQEAQKIEAVLGKKEKALEDAGAPASEYGDLYSRIRPQ